MKIYWWSFLPCWRQSCWRILFVWLSVLISTFITLGICMEMWLAFPQKFSFCCFSLFLLDSDSFVCSITITFTATNSILPEAAFWQEAKGRSKRSRGGLKVQRSYFHESALCNGKMKRQKCCSVLIFSTAMIHTTYLQLLYHFPSRCSKVFQSSCCSVAGRGVGLNTMACGDTPSVWRRAASKWCTQDMMISMLRICACPKYFPASTDPLVISRGKVKYRWINESPPCLCCSSLGDVWYGFSLV